MIYQPRNVQPSFLSIDGAENNVFTMEIATNNYINGYKLTILNWDNTVFYSGSKVSLTTYVYNEDTLSISVPSSIGLVNGTDYKWYVDLYQPSATMKITYGLTQEPSSIGTTIYIQNNINIKVGMYLKIGNETQQIISYTIDQTLGYATAIVGTAFTTIPTAATSYEVYSDFIETIPEYILYVRANPTVSISNMPTLVDKKFFNFQGTYTQTDGVPLVYNQWQLFVLGNNSSYDLIYDTGKQYSADLTFSYDGFKSGQTYSISLTVEDEYGIVASTGQKVFSVSYNTIEYLQQPTAKMSPLYNAIQVNWSTPVSFKPTTYYYYKYIGTIQAGTITATSLYVDKGLTITPYYDFITINGLILNYIYSYDPETGLLIGIFNRFSGVTEGASYFISHYSSEGMANVPILKDTPYKNTNSAQLTDYALSYNDLAESGEIGTMPTDFNITSQLLISPNFFFGVNNTYRNRMPIAILLTGETDPLLGSIIMYAHNYNLGALWAQYNSSGVVYDALPSGTNTNQTVYLGKSIDISSTPYILFANSAYSEYISSFDSTTMIATLENPLPFVPAQGDIYCLCYAQEAPFYSGVNEMWVLQSNPLAMSNGDYMWVDENNSWPNSSLENSVCWVEGGGPTTRISQNWWKVQITNSSIRIEKGGS